jgi:geranylgeranyl pyrophosphate synthase
MSANPTLTTIKKAFKQRGGPAMKNARKTIMQNFKDNSYSSQALRYFSKITLHNALPVFPALIAMSCEAVGGDAEKTIPFGEAIVMISAAADLHDDVIDQSFTKGSKKTVLGKFNAGTSILAGDILLVYGLEKLADAADELSKVQGKKILKMVSESVSEICIAESLEIQLHNQLDVTPAKYLEIISLKAVVNELTMKIGAIIGNGSFEEVKKLGEFGRTYGINSIIIEEFVDLLNIEELKNRIKNECLPLPIIYALQNPHIKTNILSFLSSELLNESDHKKVVEIVINSAEVEVLQKILVSNATTQVKQLPLKVNGKMRKELQNLLLVPLTYLEI